MEPQPPTAITKRSSNTELMPPPAIPKRIKRPKDVLDEDVYTNALEHIIARDFFPGLLESQAQKNYLEALESNDNDWIRESGRQLMQVMTPGPSGSRGRRGTSMAHTTRGTSIGVTPGATPRKWEGATPTRVPSATPVQSTEDGRAEQPKVDLDMSLGAFQAKYTSEDNESFNGLLDKQNLKRAEQHAYLHDGNKILAPRQIAHRAREQKLLQDRTSAAMSDAITLRPSLDQDARPASIDSFPNRSGPRNTLMFGPDSIEDTHTTTAQAAQERSLAAPKSVKYTSTRLPTQDSTAAASTIPPSPSLSAIDEAIAGRPRPTASEPDYSGASTPRVKGYAFVDAEPTPSELGLAVSDEEADRIEREAAMALMPKVDGDAGSSLFKLQNQSRREELHHRLVDKNDKSRRKIGARLDVLRKSAEGRTPTPSFASSPAVGGAAVKGNLTPAGRLLAERIGGTPGRGSTAFGQDRAGTGIGKTWTPTPGIKRVEK